MIAHSTALSELAQHFIAEGFVDRDSINKGIDLTEKENSSFISYLVKNKILSSEIILKKLASLFRLKIFDLANFNIQWLEQSPLSLEFIRRYRMIPLEKQQNTLQVALADPTQHYALDAAAFCTGLQIIPFLISEDQLTQFFENYCNEQTTHFNLQLNLLKQIKLDEPIYPIHQVQENTIVYEEPLIQFVDNIIHHAFQQTVSDVHIEPSEKQCRIRYRQYGVLYGINEIPNQLALRVISRLKVMAKLDIAEKRLPQDGRFQLENIDIRINTCPTLWGEKIVLRLLNADKFLLELKQLGLSAIQYELLMQKISAPQGMILVTGPTGSGKTVTLYSALAYLNHIEKNILTVEDPIEIRLPGINQVNINPKIGLDFSQVLRTFLRQDPDIIMVGEIRDIETANIAIQAAQTGHLVLSTLHTNGALETISRLQSMGIASYNIVSAISLIIAQRLIRVLCEHCKIPETHPEYSKNSKNSEIIFKAIGCKKCSHGYSGRLAVYEFLPMTETISELILKNASMIDLQAAAKKLGFIELYETGSEKVQQGITSRAELSRAIKQ